MQTLEQRNTYTPPNDSLVRCNCELALNREETLSVSELKTYSNNPEVNLLVSEVPDNRNLRVSYSKNLSLLTTNTIAGALILRLLMQGVRFIYWTSPVVFSTP